MENKNNNYVKEALDKIESRKVLLNNKALYFDKKINFLQNYINDNKIAEETIIWKDMKMHILTSLGYYAYFLAFMAGSSIKDDRTMFWFLYSYSFAEIINNLIYENQFFCNDAKLKDSIRRLKHLSKENKKARKMIVKLDDELENYRKNCEAKAHDIISDIFSLENIYYDENVINKEIDKAKSIGNNN